MQNCFFNSIENLDRLSIWKYISKFVTIKLCCKLDYSEYYKRYCTIKGIFDTNILYCKIISFTRFGDVHLRILKRNGYTKHTNIILPFKFIEQVWLCESDEAPYVGYWMDEQKTDITHEFTDGLKIGLLRLFIETVLEPEWDGWDEVIYLMSAKNVRKCLKDKDPDIMKKVMNTETGNFDSFYPRIALALNTYFYYGGKLKYNLTLLCMDYIKKWKDWIHRQSNIVNISCNVDNNNKSKYQTFMDWDEQDYGKEYKEAVITKDIIVKPKVKEDSKEKEKPTKKRNKRQMYFLSKTDQFGVKLRILERMEAVCGITDNDDYSAFVFEEYDFYDYIYDTRFFIDFNNDMMIRMPNNYCKHFRFIVKDPTWKRKQKLKRIRFGKPGKRLGKIVPYNFRRQQRIENKKCKNKHRIPNNVYKRQKKMYSNMKQESKKCIKDLIRKEIKFHDCSLWKY